VCVIACLAKQVTLHLGSTAANQLRQGLDKPFLELYVLVQYLYGHKFQLLKYQRALKDPEYKLG